MSWTIEWRPSAVKELKKPDSAIQKKIFTFLKNRIAPLENPRVSGKSLSYEKFGLWRYRVENYRIICLIDDAAITILVVQVGHRKDIYE